MIRVGFIIKDINSWTGGFNYYKSLLSAIKKLGARRKIEPVIFTAASQAAEVTAKLNLGFECAGLSCLEGNSLLSYLGRALKKTFGRNLVFEKALAAHKIDVISHVSNADADGGLIMIGWIPDFQHIHLPDMFGPELLAYRNRTYTQMAEKADAVILSSLDALNDYKKFAPDFAGKGRALNFAQSVAVDNFDAARYETIKAGYKLPDKYFYIPNQFWKHKNHIIALKALKILKDSGKPVPSIVFSGLSKDYRNAGYLNGIENFINDAGLKANAIMLGLIDYQEVYYLMRYSTAVINPSLFEGWSSTVEECKAIDKNIILSNIKVHIEQAPAKADYFDPRDAQGLAAILERYFSAPPAYDDGALAARLKAHELKTVEFGENYQNIVLSLTGRDKVNKKMNGGI
jgi:glycosyltransferase involved in cell wall biosynthesis